MLSPVSFGVARGNTIGSFVHSARAKGRQLPPEDVTDLNALLKANPGPHFIDLRTAAELNAAARAGHIPKPRMRAFHRAPWNGHPAHSGIIFAIDEAGGKQVEQLARASRKAPAVPFQFETDVDRFNARGTALPGLDLFRLERERAAAKA